MTKQFNGTIALDIRDSVPDWEPYAEPKAPEGSPNILYIVIDDTGFGAWDMFGGKIKMPNFNEYVAKPGLIYTNFHTTALCSPTRSSLLNGRNANSNGMACIEEATSGFPGSNGRIPFENALLSEVLVERGYNTYAIGKWHLLPEEEANMAATKRHWPLGRGFERYYGFLGGETDQWYPDIIYDNHLIEPPYKPDMEDTEKGYHLSKDFVDKAIQFIKDAKVIAPDKPWMLYFSPGANHAPHQIWPQKIYDYGYNTGEMDADGKYPMETSVFKDGYEKYREDVFTKMKEMGIFLDDTELPPINPHGEHLHEEGKPDFVGPAGQPWPQTEYVRPWDTLTDQEKELFVRMAETYAAFSTYTDEQIGRLFKYLEDSGQLDNTIIIALADNGASAEGGPNGSVNENLFFNDIPDDPGYNYSKIGVLGTDQTYNHYPTGWACAFDTPFKYWKRWSGYEGGSAAPFMISWPQGIPKAKDLKPDFRKQYIHAVDLVPTLYECLGLEPPEVVKGYTQNPIEGISFKYTFAPGYADPNYVAPDDDPNKPKKVKQTQFYAMLGTRGIYHKGWHACTFHPPTPSDWSNFPLDKWELYFMAEDPNLTDREKEQLTQLKDQYPFVADPTQCKDLAEQFPEKLEEMKNIWFAQAGKYNGLPLDDRSTSEVLGEPRPQLSEPRNDYTYYPGCSEVPEAVAVNIRGRSYKITATVDFSNSEEISAVPAIQGMTLSVGGQLHQISGPMDLSQGATINIGGRSYNIKTVVEKVPTLPAKVLPELNQQVKGVLFAHGGRFGGHSLYIHENQLCYVYNWLGQYEQKVSCPLPENPSGCYTFSAQFDKTDTDDQNSTLGNVSLYINDEQQNLDISINGELLPSGQTAEFKTQPGKFSLSGEGLNVGRDGGQPVSRDYESPGEFEGATIQQVVVHVENDQEETNTEKEFAGMLWRD
ncbi:arylsulfatase [Microseira wollei]|uniref:Sulfatase n=1 Tax=Microseira wollei NIES-4236 TaxID=2530354 RepID=A0AAV3X3D9_9CYAN|nr:arylsulfatase [Microseira wollei]GET35721.1 sulfatase [Microseira wollei NIES-4236]